MRIVETEINDIPNSNLNEAKTNLANNIISYAYPLFKKDYQDQVKEIKTLKKSLIDKKEKIKIEKTKLESLLKDFSKKDKESQLLTKMGKLIQTGLIQEAMKTEMIVLLKSFEHMKEEKIVSYLNETIRIISQKFAKT